jgi:TIR domain
VASIPLQKRPNDLFVSYGHADRDLVAPVVDWLVRSAGFKVWYDTSSGTAARRSPDLLGSGIESARGALFFVSPNWGASTWCRDEHAVALNERRRHSDFFVLAAQISDGEIPTWFATAQVLDLRTFDAASGAALLRSLAPNPPLRLDNAQDVYVSGPWSAPSDAAKKALHALDQWGWRLVGDSPDHPHFADAVQRITSIIRTSRGLVAVLPFQPSQQPHATSPWILKEAGIAEALGKPYLLVAEQGVTVPPELDAQAFGGGAVPLSPEGPDEAFHAALQAFDELLDHHAHSDARAYSFLASSLLGNPPELDMLAGVVERATNMTCVRGRYLAGQHAQEAIVERISKAAFVIADVTDDSRNSLIEAGVARGARVPLHLLCRLPGDGSRKTRFMFQDLELNWYSTPLERLAAAHRVSRAYRRRVYASAEP